MRIASIPSIVIGGPMAVLAWRMARAWWLFEVRRTGETEVRTSPTRSRARIGDR